MKKSGIFTLCLVALMSISAAFSAACTGGQPDSGDNPGDDNPGIEQPGGDETPSYDFNPSLLDPVTVTHTQSVLLEGTIWETAVHKYVTDKQGPKIAIVGGIHGDEKAGWTTALQLVDKFNEEMFGICGEILLIPQANIIADTRVERYPGRASSKNGVAKVDGIEYSDLNRSFPDGRQSQATKATVTISDAIRTAVEEFDADYIIDLHESLHSWKQMDETSTSLGDTLIYKNQALFMDDVIYYYNQVYRPDNETLFNNNPTGTKGSFNLYFSNLFPERVVFTVETNRQYVTGAGDGIALETRVRQQTNILNSLFDIVWKRVDTEKIL